jgi:hypothetical protein
MLDKNLLLDEIKYYEDGDFYPVTFMEWIVRKIKAGCYDIQIKEEIKDAR